MNPILSTRPQDEGAEVVKPSGIPRLASRKDLTIKMFTKLTWPKAQNSKGL